MTDLPIDITFEVMTHLDALGVDYMLVGSVASSLQGVARSTIDADLVADLSNTQAEALVERLEIDFYISSVAVKEALSRRSMFNVVQFSSGFKVDIYILGNRPFDREEFSRRTVYTTNGRRLWVATPEDLIISKLDWYRLGGEVSDRQWRDLLGLLEIHRESLDRAYLERWVVALGLQTLWQRAIVATRFPGGSL